MKKTNHRIRNIIVFTLVFFLLTGAVIPTAAASFGTRYDADAAVAYAAAHWNDGMGVCDEFVKDCMNAGGVEILAGGVEHVKNALTNIGLGTEHLLKISSDGVHALASENPNAQPGDLLFFYCKECKVYIHSAIFGGISEAGYLYSYGHNPGWDRVDWFGNFTHTLNNGDKHRGCYDYVVIHMNRENFSHVHSFTTGHYEDAHPHKMFALCNCGAQYYLGWNATVSSCTICNAPSADVPIVTVTSDGESISLQWTTVKDAVGYQVWRARSETGTYFKLYEAMGTRMVNKSVEAGNTYYYKVIAILAKDGNGNVTKSVSSDIVTGTLSEPTPDIPEPPAAPVVSGVLNAANKAVVSWPAAANATKYEVWRSTSENGTYTKLITTAKLTCTNSPKPGTYYYKVRALDANGLTGEYSNIVCVTVPGELDPIPSITGKLNTNNKAVISWNPVAGAASYEVWRSTSENGTYKKLITTTNLYSINTPKAGTYYYKVRAIDTNGITTEYSNVVCVVVK